MPKLARLFYVHHFLLAQNLSSKYIAPPESEDAYKHASRIELVKNCKSSFIMVTGVYWPTAQSIVQVGSGIGKST